MKVSVLRIFLALAGVLVAFVAAVFLVIVLGPGPGEGPKGERGKALGGLIIASLENYRRAHGVYPSQLEQLKETPPLSGEALAEVLNGEVQFDYEPREPNTYQLGFRYGPDHCQSMAIWGRPAEWECYGAY